ncbi:MAG: LLM class flavin-dependent oxidoreductase, partial [Chloroflexota bacterium]
PILVGGSGPRRTIPLVARHADMWNSYGSPAQVAAADALLRAACAEVGRDPEAIDRTVNVNVVIRSSRAEAERAWAGWYDVHQPHSGEGTLDAGGTIDEVASVLAGYRAVGFRHPVMIFRTPWDLETIGQLPALRAALAATG